MSADRESPTRIFVLMPDEDLGHAIARKLRETAGVQVIGISTDPDQDAYRIFDYDPDVIVADFAAGGLKFLYSDRLPPGEHRVVFFAPRSDAGCDACYEALVHGAEGIMCRPSSPNHVEQCSDLAQSLRKGTPLRAEDCPAVKRLQEEVSATGED